MLDLETYLSGGSKRLPRDRSNGIPAQWTLIGELEITTGTIRAGDPYLANEGDGLSTPVPNGRHAVEARGYDFEGCRVVGRMRARLAEAASASTGREIGTAGTDSALIAVCDLKRIDAAIDGGGDEFQEMIEAFPFARFGALKFEMSGGIESVYANSGFGDGAGPVYELLDPDNRRVGIELDFVCQDRE